jgi:hypothetical protein
MARIKFSELVKQTMKPESIARSRKAAIEEIISDRRLWLFSLSAPKRKPSMAAENYRA